MKLTVEVAAQQLQSESRPLLVVHWMNPDVTSHKRGNKLVVFYPGVVQITVEYLEKKRANLVLPNLTEPCVYKLIPSAAGSNWFSLIIYWRLKVNLM